MTFKDLRYYNLSFVNIGGKVKYLFRLTTLYNTLRLLKKNNLLVENRKNDIIYICGLGPSLADVDLDKIADMSNVDTLVCNYFVKMADKTKLKPTYYMMVDAGFVKPKHRPALEKAIELYPDTKFIWNSSFQVLDPSTLNYPCEKYFIAMYNGYYIKPKQFNITKVTPAFGNVICAAIGFAIGAGYKKIVLLGCDFNSFAFPHEVHCYDGGKENKGARRVSLAQELFSYSFDAAVHENLSAYAKSLNVEIVNATRGSLIDAYKRIDISELYNN